MFAYLYLYSLSNCNRPEVTSFKGCHYINVCPFIYMQYYTYQYKKENTYNYRQTAPFRSNIIHACLLVLNNSMHVFDFS